VSERSSARPSGGAEQSFARQYKREFMCPAQRAKEDFYSNEKEEKDQMETSVFSAPAVSWFRWGDSVGGVEVVRPAHRRPT